MVLATRKSLPWPRICLLWLEEIPPPYILMEDTTTLYLNGCLAFKRKG